MRLAHFRASGGDVGLNLLWRHARRHASLDALHEIVEPSAPFIGTGEMWRQVGIDCLAYKVRHAGVFLGCEMLQGSQLLVIQVNVRPLHLCDSKLEYTSW